MVNRLLPWLLIAVVVLLALWLGFGVFESTHPTAGGAAAAAEEGAALLEAERIGTGIVAPDAGDGPREPVPSVRTPAVPTARAIRTIIGVRVLDEVGRPCPEVEVGRMRRAPMAAARAESAMLASNDPPPFEARVRTDSAGRAEFTYVDSGVHWVGIAPTRAPWDAADAAALAPVAQRVVLASGEPRPEVVLRTWRGLYMRGRVEVPEGSAPGAATRVVLIAHAVETGGGLTGDVSADGRFALGPVTDCAYRLETFGGDFAPIEPLIVRASEGEIVLRLAPGARLAGRVVDAVSGEGAQCEVVLTPLGGEEDEVLGSSDGQGAFAFGGLSPGAYAVSAFTRDGRVATIRPAPVAVDAPQRELELRLATVEQCARVRVVLEGEIEPGRVGLWSGGSCRSAAFVGGPDACTLAAPPGELDVRLFAGPEFLERRPVQTKPGTTSEVRIRR